MLYKYLYTNAIIVILIFIVSVTVTLNVNLSVKLFQAIFSYIIARSSTEFSITNYSICILIVMIMVY